MDTAMAELSRRIINYEENLKTGNLMLVHLKPFCISSMDNNLKPFEELCRLLKKKQDIGQTSMSGSSRAQLVGFNRTNISTSAFH
ncbi:MAG: hypothetical protein ACJ72C_11325 [Nitrososphaeraceae archaeon]